MVYETMVINRLAQKRGDFVPAPQIKRFSYSTAPPVHEPAPNIPAPFFRPGSVQILNELIVKGIELGRVRKDDFRNAFTNNLFNPLVGDCNIGVDRRGNKICRTPRLRRKFFRLWPKILPHFRSIRFQRFFGGWRIVGFNLFWEVGRIIISGRIHRAVTVTREQTVV